MPSPQSKKVFFMQFNPLTASVVSLLSLGLAACGGAETSTASKANASTTDGALNSALDADRAREGALGDMVLGSPDANVTLVEYASFTCGHCATFHASVFPDIKERFIETGLIKFVFRELPTPPQQLSYIGSVLARCAADKGGDEAFFAVGDGLFKKQRDWVFGNDPKLELLKITNQAGMDEAALETCLSRQEIVDVINTNVTEANEVYKITGTPSFVMNGEKLELKTLADLDNALTAAVEAAGGSVPPKAGEEAAVPAKTDPVDEPGQ